MSDPWQIERQALALEAIAEQLRVANLIALASVPKGLGMGDIATDARLALQEDGAIVERWIPGSTETYQVQAKKPRPEIARTLGLEVES